MEQYTFSDKYPYAQLALTFLTVLSIYGVAIIISFLIANPLFGLSFNELSNLQNLSKPNFLNAMIFFQIMHSIAIFVIPSLILGRIFSGSGKQYLKITTNPKIERIALALMIMITALPFINFLAMLNSLIKFPAFLSGVETYLQESQKQNEQLTNAFLSASTIKGLFINILMIGIVPAIGEEFFFRGVLQRIFCNMTKNVHFGIIFTSFIFSAIHFEFYGLLPRWLLGIMFGYMLIWSGSIWLPICAHFLNNTIAVVLSYYINSGAVKKEMADIGSTNQILPFTIVSTIFAAYGLYILYKKRINLMQQ